MWLKSFNKFCFWVTAQMLPRLNGHFIIDDFINVSHGLHMTKMVHPGVNLAFRVMLNMTNVDTITSK